MCGPALCRIAGVFFCIEFVSRYVDPALGSIARDQNGIALHQSAELVSHAI
jgi:hypothetical protein